MAVVVEEEGESWRDRNLIRSERMPVALPRNLPMRAMSTTTTRIMINHSMRCPFSVVPERVRPVVVVGSLDRFGPYEEPHSASSHPHFVAPRGSSRR